VGRVHGYTYAIWKAYQAPGRLSILHRSVPAILVALKSLMVTPVPAHNGPTQPKPSSRTRNTVPPNSQLSPGPNSMPTVHTGRVEGVGVVGCTGVGAGGSGSGAVGPLSLPQAKAKVRIRVQRYRCMMTLPNKFMTNITVGATGRRFIEVNVFGCSSHLKIGRQAGAADRGQAYGPAISAYHILPPLFGGTTAETRSN